MFSGAEIADTWNIPAESSELAESPEPTPYDRPSFCRMRTASREFRKPPPSM
jgi:hypothetical protein